MSTFKKIFFAFLFIAVSGTSNASIVTVNGDTVSFTYDNVLNGLFGTPTVSGNSLVFLPTNFKAVSLDGGSTALTSSTFQVKIDRLDGHHITNIALTEKGDYLLNGANAKVADLGELRASDVIFPFQDYVSKIESVNPFAQTGLASTTNWVTTANLAFAPNTISSLFVSIENILFAQSDMKHDIAFIEKKFVGLTVTAVPLPQALWLFCAGMMGLLSMSKRKKLL
ncbi:hypothetical protein [Methylobacter sp. S3L5C]|uniref:hypothetical protein n=1 Tax=Methylobacter sp. S3L5C TaxID=2839024 RepID=UPI001FABDCC8|nr:hypothetical protein [Methylobacter sp. S3L5C]UOA09006.1 hypothetical protein KKZ03_01410 [Methylobacter sp. S3L5C]